MPPDSTMQAVDTLDRITGGDPLLMALAVAVLAMVGALGILWRYFMKRQERLDTYSDRTVEVIATYAGELHAITKALDELRAAQTQLQNHCFTVNNRRDS